MEISYCDGTLIVRLEEESNEALLRSVPDCSWDTRIGAYRLPGYRYFHLISTLYQHKIAYRDEAKGYETLTLQTSLEREPFDYQKEALASWLGRHRRGYVVLPTGAGKTYVAILAMLNAGRSTIVLVPTLELMHQWYDLLYAYFDREIGLLGGGYHEPLPLTVTTYDSAYLHMERLGNRFGLIIFDECHHLPSASYRLAAQMAIAPYRLGLTATPERVDDGHLLLEDLIGPCVLHRSIRELAGDYLADYEVVQLYVDLSPAERQEYLAKRGVYLNFLQQHEIRLAGGGWHRFIARCAVSVEGRRAFQAYLRQKEIAQAAPAKLRVLERLLRQHRRDRVLIFTNDNATAYTIAKEFLVPVITHQTKTKERREILLGFNRGTYPVLATSHVLNEGINVPEANIGIVLSGTGSVREHVQRLGRILRKQEGKQATLYEIVTAQTSEEYVSERRREHDAYHR